MSLSGNVVALATRIANEIRDLRNKFPTVVKEPYPATRPTATQVIWVGATDPGSLAANGDFWTGA